jgi:hypothetical protein
MMIRRLVRRAAARTLLRLKRETVLRPIGPICMEEWTCCRDIVAEEMTKLLNREVSEYLKVPTCCRDIVAEEMTKLLPNDHATWTEQELMRAVNESCSCGGKGPDDGCCQSCEVWHRLNGRTPNARTEQQPPTGAAAGTQNP